MKKTIHPLAGAQLSMVVFVYVFLSPFPSRFSISKMTSCRVFKLQLEVGKSDEFSHWKWAKNRWRVTAAQTPGRPASWALTPLHINPIPMHHPPAKTIQPSTHRPMANKEVCEGYTQAAKKKNSFHMPWAYIRIQKELVCPVYFLKSVCSGAQANIITKMVNILLFVGH